ncbi:MAG: radical SAM protein [Thermoplasmata archaeon]|nr:radical SAM protein [Thermoplasmata archaeon]
MIESFQKYADENGYEVLEITKSVDENTIGNGRIPETIDAAYIEKDGTVYLLKKNGTIERIGTKEYWDKIMKFKATEEFVAKINTNIKHKRDIASCGLCNEHKNTTALLNIVLTNRCDLRCWYCFFYEEKAGFVYEPSIEEIREELEVAKKMNGYTPPVQLTGGEPSLRDDLDVIIKMIKDMGSPHVQLNTNSVSLGIDYYENKEKTVEKVKKWKEAGLNTIYTSFDGLTADAKSNIKNHYEIPFALEAYREGGVRSIVLVPTVSQLNLHETPDIARFAMHNVDKGIKGVNFQPISLVGYIKKGDRDKLRVVQSDIVDEMKKHFGVGMEAWYPVPAVASLADVIGNEPHVHFYNNEKCGIATYAYVDRERKKLIPITEFIDVDRFLKEIDEMHGSKLKKAVFGAKLIPGAIVHGGIRKALAKKLGTYIIQDELPNGNKLSAILDAIFEKGDYKSLGMFHNYFLFFGMMHFQDYYNYDVNRVQRCSIHYAAGRRIIPFCTYNVFPDIHRDRFLKIHRVKGEKEKELQEKSREAKERVIKFREKKDEIISSPIYREVYAFR